MIRSVVIAIVVSTQLASVTHGVEPGEVLKTTTLWRTFSVTETGEVSSITSGTEGRYFTTGFTHSDGLDVSNLLSEIRADGRRKWTLKEWVDSSDIGEAERIVYASDDFLWVISVNAISKFTTTGRHLLSKELWQITAASVIPSRAIAAGKGGLILSGSVHTDGKKRSDGWLAEVDERGSLIWEKFFDLGEDEFIDSVALNKKGELFFAASSGTADKFGPGMHTVWVGKCDRKGKKLLEYKAKGQVTSHGGTAIAATEAGVLVGYNRARFPNLEPVVTCLSAEMQERWTTQLAPKRVGVYTPVIVSLDRDLQGALHIAVQNGSDDSLAVGMDGKGKILFEREFQNARGFPVPSGDGEVRIFIQKMTQR